MGLLLPGLADAAPQPPLCLLPDPPLQFSSPHSYCRALVVVAGGGRDLDWSPLSIAAALSAAAAGLNPALDFFYQSTEDADMLEMSFNLRRCGEPFLTRRPERYWWLTGFKWGIYSTTDQLTMDVVIKAPAADIHAGLVAALTGMHYDVQDDGVTVRFTFDKPFAPRPWTNNSGLPAVQAAQKAIVTDYQTFKLPINDPNQIAPNMEAQIQSAVIAMGADFFGELMASGLCQIEQFAYQAAGIFANNLLIGAEGVDSWLTGADFNLEFSCYAQIHNGLSGPLTLQRQDLQIGHFIILPSSIPACMDRRGRFTTASLMELTPPSPSIARPGSIRTASRAAAASRPGRALTIGSRRGKCPRRAIHCSCAMKLPRA